MGDDPSLVVEQEGVVAALVRGEEGRRVLARVDVLGELHQVAVVKGEEHHAGEIAFAVEKRCTEADHPLVNLAVVGAFRVRGARQLFLFAYVKAGQV